MAENYHINKNWPLFRHWIPPWNITRGIREWGRQGWSHRANQARCSQKINEMVEETSDFLLPAINPPQWFWTDALKAILCNFPLKILEWVPISQELKSTFTLPHPSSSASSLAMLPLHPQPGLQPCQTSQLIIFLEAKYSSHCLFRSAIYCQPLWLQFNRLCDDYFFGSTFSHAKSIINPRKILIVTNFFMLSFRS